jgi:hypothetical protein
MIVIWFLGIKNRPIFSLDILPDLCYNPFRWYNSPTHRKDTIWLILNLPIPLLAVNSLRMSAMMITLPTPAPEFPARSLSFGARAGLALLSPFQISNPFKRNLRRFYIWLYFFEILKKIKYCPFLILLNEILYLKCFLKLFILLILLEVHHGIYVPCF